MHAQFLGLAAAVALGSCATRPGLVDASTVALAAEAPPEGLRARAEAGEARAQLAWSLVLDNGLNGMAPDRAAAASWRQRSVQPRGMTNVVAYTPAFNGRSSRVTVIPVQRRDVNVVDVRHALRCAAALKTTAPGVQDVKACGGGGQYARLLASWLRAEPSDPVSR